MAERPGVAVLVPALDEEEALPGVVRDLRERGFPDVVVVDNGSTDRSATVARAAGARVVAEPRRGYGSACLAGIRALAARERPPAVVVFLDADDREARAHLARVVDPILEDRADFVVGVRTAAGAPGVPVHARLGNRLVLGLARLLFGQRWDDLGPFRAIRFSTLLDLGMDDPSWGWTLQMQLRAARSGARVEQPRVPHRARELGRSKISGSLPTSLRVGARMFWTLIRERLRP